MEARRLPRFVRGVAELCLESLGAKRHFCPHCGRSETLVGHGLVRGYAARGSSRVVRGRRLLCSNRYRRRGCGRTVAVLLATTLVGRVVDSIGLAALWAALVRGEAPSAVLAVPVSGRSRNRLAQRLRRSQHHLRTLLSTVSSPPSSSACDPLAQLWDHLCRVFAGQSCPVAAFQRSFQSSVLI